MKINSPKISIIIALAAIISSCNTGNKVASSFGKRKYTKGFYLDTHRKPDLPVITANTISTVKNKPLKEKNNIPRLSFQTPSSSVNTLINLPKNSISKISNSVKKDKAENIWPLNFR